MTLAAATYRSIGFIRTDEGTKPHPHDRSRHGADGELLLYHRKCVEVFVAENDICCPHHHDQCGIGGGYCCEQCARFPFKEPS